MTKLQKRIITVAGVVTVGMLLFPPWYRVFERQTYAGYWLLFGLDPAVSISWDRLVLQLAACWVLAGVVWFICGTSDKSG
jgi:DNA primase